MAESYGGRYGQLVGKAVRHPGRALLRLVLHAKQARLDEARERQKLFAALSRRFGVDAQSLHTEYVESDFARAHRERQAELDRFPGPSRLGTTPEFGCEALYLLMRAARPRMVVETGVHYGASSAYILAALGLALGLLDPAVALVG